MSQLKDQQTGASGDNFTVGGNLAVTGTTTFTGIPSGPTASTGTSTTQLATTAFVLSNGNPTGGIMMWGTGTAPTGWLLCAGTAVSRTTYAALFAVIGTTFGSGDGSTTFNLPNYTNRMPYGTTLAATGGSADAVVVSHTHTATSTVTDPSHSHTIPFGARIGTGSNTSDSQGGNTISTNSATTGITVSTTNESTGVSGTNANLPPYIGINFIIKI
jgi:microcystin-dependent protein